MMTAEQVSAITSESDDKKAMREGLSTKLEVFRAGADMCKEYSVRESACECLKVPRMTINS